MSSNDTDTTAGAIMIDDLTEAADDGLARFDGVEVRRDGPLSLVLGLLAGGIALAWLVRAVGSGSGWDWLICGGMLIVSALHLAVVADSRAPLMVLDGQGVRARAGHRWTGMAWGDVARVEHRVRERMLRDGRFGVVDGEGRRLSIRLSLSTRLHGCDWHELGDVVEDLSGGAHLVETRPVAEADRVPPTPDAPAPDRTLNTGQRSDLALERVAQSDGELTTILPRSVASPTPADPAETSLTVVIEELESEQHAGGPVVDPVVGAPVQAARQRLRLTVEQLAERTRIRPHVIEAIELDDFGPCGGDFYARGHLRTLARVLGLDGEKLVADFDERYGDEPVEARRVFEAELATGPGGTIRGTGGRLNWSVLVAVVMAAVLVWSIARLVMDAPVPLSDRPILNGSPSGKAQLSGQSTKVPVEFTAATGGARVIVRDARGRVVFDERLTFMQTARVQVAPPVRISTTDGGLQVAVDGQDQGALGATGEDAQRVYAS